ncbi:Tat pathway signal sequence domain protein [Edwardsiella tarda ATCC 23685]|uniref:Tat pathway signal sequence domain protein n=1 Tax=Edwardsiella tarda ATCC 23685 TaxID=500638 RepID=D4F7I7_EDWTA|nr:Tat pathway signal sequence domain protein [Edwardsiella tarda ATCC 23685]
MTDKVTHITRWAADFLQFSAYAASMSGAPLARAGQRCLNTRLYQAEDNRSKQ